MAYVTLSLSFLLYEPRLVICLSRLGRNYLRLRSEKSAPATQGMGGGVAVLSQRKPDPGLPGGRKGARPSPQGHLVGVSGQYLMARHTLFT